MKKALYAFGIVLAAGIGWFIHARVVHLPIDNGGVTQINSQQCYIWNTEGGEHATLRLQMEGSTVTGSYYWSTTPDVVAVGPFSGVKEVDDTGGPNLVSAWWLVSGDGVPQVSELRFKIAGDIVQMAKNVRKDRGDGVFIYTNPAILTYDIPLQKTDCNDPAVK